MPCEMCRFDHPLTDQCSVAQDRAAAAADNAPGAAAQRLLSLFPDAQPHEGQAALRRQSMVSPRESMLVAGSSPYRLPKAERETTGTRAPAQTSLMCPGANADVQLASRSAYQPHDLST